MVVGALVSQLRRVSAFLERPLIHLRIFADGEGTLHDGNEELADFGNLDEASDVLDDVEKGRLKVPFIKLKGGKIVTQDQR